MTHEHIDCPTCHGHGHVMPCRDCDGTGQIIYEGSHEEVCPTCNGLKFLSPETLRGTESPA